MSFPYGHDNLKGACNSLQGTDTLAVTGIVTLIGTGHNRFLVAERQRFIWAHVHTQSARGTPVVVNNGNRRVSRWLHRTRSMKDKAPTLLP